MSKRERKIKANLKAIHGGAGIPSGAAFDDLGWHPLDTEIDRNRDKAFLKKVKPRSEGQARLVEAIRDHALTLAIGPAGSGKTYLAITAAVEALEEGKIEKIVLSRPAMEAGESLGFLPGDMHEKMAPYLRPLYDALGDRMGGKRVRQYLDDGIIEIAPVGFMRGRTLNNAFVVIDEAQNCTYAQLKMLVSRLGWHSTMVITGDPNQSDLLDGMSGLSEVARRFEPLQNIAVIKLEQADIVRHPLVAEMLDVM
jgi:phosphate starvation-inducible PhoH-like protein